VFQSSIQKGERSGLRMHRDDGKRSVMRADEKLTAFVELGTRASRSRLRSDARVKSLREFFSEKSGTLPYRQRTAA
jgi:hypothetical protein